MVTEKSVLFFLGTQEGSSGSLPEGTGARRLDLDSISFAHLQRAVRITGVVNVCLFQILLSGILMLLSFMDRWRVLQIKQRKKWVQPVSAVFAQCLLTQSAVLGPDTALPAFPCAYILVTEATS